MLSNFELEDLAKKMSVPLERVCFKDELDEEHLKFNRSYIVNMEDSVDENGKQNEGTHWTCFQVNKYPNGLIEPIYFDSYGVAPSVAVKKFVEKSCNTHLNFTTRDIQSLMGNACGFFCLAFLHFINHFPHRSKELYRDTDTFLTLFDDLNVSCDWKRNEFILRLFFQSEDVSKRSDLSNVLPKKLNDDPNKKDMMKIPVDVAYV
jgi:hypothetical protein